MFVHRWVFTLLVLMLGLGLPGQLHARWKVAETTHFRLHGTIEDAALVDRAALLEDFHGLLVRTTGRRPPEGAPALDVFLVDRIADMAPRQKLPPNAAGYYLADSGRISAVALASSGDDGQSLTAQELLLHEYAHHFMLGSGRFAYPAWYVEGFAEYFATARFGPRRIDVGQPSPVRRQALADGSWLPMERILAREPDLSRGDNTALFYAQSWLLTHYLLRAPGFRDRFAAYLRACGGGADPVEAFRTHIDPDLAGFEGRLRRYLKSGAPFSSFDRPADTSRSVRLTALPADASRLLPTLVTLEHAGASPADGAALSRVRQLVGPDPVEPFARRTLALAELEGGHPAVAVALLDGLLQQAPQDADLLRWRAQAARASRSPEGLQEARLFLGRALAAAPSDWRVLHAYARLYRTASAPMPEAALAALLRAHRLAPQVSEIVLDTALALSQADRLAEAARTLEPLAWAPHGGQASAIAQRMLARARAGDRAGVLAQVSALQRPQGARIAAAPAR